MKKKKQRIEPISRYIITSINYVNKTRTELVRYFRFEQRPTPLYIPMRVTKDLDGLFTYFSKLKKSKYPEEDGKLAPISTFSNFYGFMRRHFYIE